MISGADLKLAFLKLKFITRGLGISLGLGFFALSCTQKPKLLEFQGQTMGTTYVVKYYPTAKTPSKPELAAKIDRALIDLNQKISNYIPDSEISQFNKSSSLEWQTPSLDLMAGLLQALDVGKKTNGIYDPTVGPLVALWGFGPRGPRTNKPEPSEIQALKAFVGLQHLEVSADKSQLRKLHPQVTLDYSSIGQGMGLNLMAKIMDEAGVENSMLIVGGEIITRGEKHDGPWRVAIEAPHKERGIAQRQLILGDRAICTSGNYRQFFEAEGKRYAHTIDPETGIPVQHNLISATIISPDSNALFSDAWATAMLVVGPDKGPEIAEREGLIAYFIIEQEPGVYLEKFSSKWLELYPDSEIHIP